MNANTRRAPRGYATSSGGRNYVLHRRHGEKTLCGRDASSVNCAVGLVADEELCRACVNAHTFAVGDEIYRLKLRAVPMRITRWIGSAEHHSAVVVFKKTKRTWRFMFPGRQSTRGALAEIAETLRRGRAGNHPPPSEPTETWDPAAGGAL